MPTAYVTTKIAFSNKVTSWNNMTPEEQEELSADMQNLLCHEISLCLIGDPLGAWYATLQSEYFWPLDALMVTFNDQTGELSFQFEGVIKLPRRDLSYLNSLPKNTPQTLQLSSYSVGRVVYGSNWEPTNAPCLVSKTKPKGADF